MKWSVAKLFSSTEIDTQSTYFRIDYRGDELERAELQLADVLDEEGRDADGGGVQHRGVGEVVRREQLGQHGDGLVRVRVQLAHGARGRARARARRAALRGAARAAAPPLATVHYNNKSYRYSFLV